MSELKRDFKGVWIPREVWFNKEITPLEKMFLAEIDSLDSSEQMGCFAANSHFAEMFDISEGRAANIISSLRVRGFVITVFFDGRQRGLRLSPNVKAGFTENVKSGLLKSVKSGSRKPLKQVHGKRDTILGTTLDTNLGTIEREAQAPTHPQPVEHVSNPYQFEEKEKNTPPNSAPPPLKKEPRDLLLDWSNKELETIKSWYEKAYRKFSQNDLENLVDNFLAIYGTHETYGFRVQVEQDPLKFFRGRFQLFLKNQGNFERPKQSEKTKSRILDTPNRNYEREQLF